MIEFFVAAAATLALVIGNLSMLFGLYDCIKEGYYSLFFSGLFIELAAFAMLLIACDGWLSWFRHTGAFAP